MANYKHTDSGIEFKSVPQLGLNASAGPLGRRNSYVISGDTITNILAKILNAVDINWNGAEVDENTTINTTGLLLSWIKNIETTPGEPGTPGKSAYDIAKENGYNGTLEAWLNSLKGDPGESFSIYRTYQSIDLMNQDTAVPTGKFVLISNDDVEDPDNAKLYVRTSQGTYNYICDLSGATGITGKSAFQIAQDFGYEGNDENEWLESLKGTPGKDGKDGKDGQDGKSAYELYYESTSDNPKKSQEEWLASLKGADGTMTFDDLTPEQKASLKGEPGADGTTPYIDSETKHWIIGEIDTNIVAEGVNGIDGTSPRIDLSTGNWFVGNENTGIKAQGTNGTDGKDGKDGIDGKDGADGRGISSITEYYLVSSSNSGITRSTSGWTTTIQTITSTNKYLWNYKKITYTTGDPTYTSPAIIGAYGDKGADGTDGTDGKSAYQSYYDTTSDNPKLSEADWVESLHATGGGIDVSKFSTENKFSGIKLYYGEDLILLIPMATSTSNGLLSSTDVKNFFVENYHTNKYDSFNGSIDIPKKQYLDQYNYSSNSLPSTINLNDNNFGFGKAVINFTPTTNINFNGFDYVLNISGFYSDPGFKVLRKHSGIQMTSGKTYLIIISRIPSIISGVSYMILEEVTSLEDGTVILTSD